MNSNVIADTMDTNFESMIKNKSNKYVYLKDGTHMSHSDWHAFKMDKRNELSRIKSAELRGSIEEVVMLRDSIRKLEFQLEDLLATEQSLQADIAMKKEEPFDFEGALQHEYEMHLETKNGFHITVTKLYADLKNLPILKGFQTPGIKFIIYQNEQGLGFGFDPYGFESNSHSSIAQLFDGSCINGGWMYVSGKKIILYGRSSDYGVFDDTIAAIECKAIFPKHKIECYPDIWLNDILKGQE